MHEWWLSAAGCWSSGRVVEWPSSPCVSAYVQLCKNKYAHFKFVCSHAHISLFLFWQLNNFPSHIYCWQLVISPFANVNAHLTGERGNEGLSRSRTLVRTQSQDGMKEILKQPRRFMRKWFAIYWTDVKETNLCIRSRKAGPSLTLHK